MEIFYHYKIIGFQINYILSQKYILIKQIKNRQKTDTSDRSRRELSPNDYLHILNIGFYLLYFSKHGHNDIIGDRVLVR